MRLAGPEVKGCCFMVDFMGLARDFGLLKFGGFDLRSEILTRCLFFVLVVASGLIYFQ